jgi:hypothetical protein
VRFPAELPELRAGVAAGPADRAILRDRVIRPVGVGCAGACLWLRMLQRQVVDALQQAQRCLVWWFRSRIILANFGIGTLKHDPEGQPSDLIRGRLFRMPQAIPLRQHQALPNFDEKAKRPRSGREAFLQNCK